MTAGEIAEVAGVVAGPFSIALGKIWMDLRAERRDCAVAIANSTKRLEDRIAAIESASDARIKSLEISRDEYVEKRVADQREAAADLGEVSRIAAQSLDSVTDEVRALRADIAVIKEGKP